MICFRHCHHHFLTFYFILTDPAMKSLARILKIPSHGILRGKEIDTHHTVIAPVSYIHGSSDMWQIVANHCFHVQHLYSLAGPKYFSFVSHSSFLLHYLPSITQNG